MNMPTHIILNPESPLPKSALDRLVALTLKLQREHPGTEFQIHASDHAYETSKNPLVGHETEVYGNSAADRHLNRACEALHIVGDLR